jgi:hypothetical protein
MAGVPALTGNALVDFDEGGFHDGFPGTGLIGQVLGLMVLAMVVRPP